MTPDEAFADQHPGDPQTWNLYMYARNNPLRNVDPNGRGTVGAIALGIATGVGSFLYHSTPIPGAVQAVRDLSNIRAAMVRQEAQSQAITGAIKALGSSEGRAGLVKAAGNAWNGMSTTDKASVVTQGVLAVGTAVAGGFVGGAGSAGASADGALAAAIATRTGNPAAMIGAIDATTGATAVGVSGPISRLGAISPDLAAVADQIGGVGALNPGAASPVGSCAEFDAANQLMNQGSALEDINFTDAIRPRTGEVVPPCTNCQQMFGK